MAGEGKGKAGADVAKPVGLEDEGTGTEKKGEEGEFPACMDVQVYKECMAIMDEQRKKIWGEDANFWCKSLRSSYFS